MHNFGCSVSYGRLSHIRVMKITSLRVAQSVRQVLTGTIGSLTEVGLVTLPHTIDVRIQLFLRTVGASLNQQCIKISDDYSIILKSTLLSGLVVSNDR